MRCGKEITNPQSLEYGLGIECIKKVPFPSPVRDINDPDEVKKLMKEVTWEGWVIKSAIIKKKELTREEFDQVAV